jgi:hypothetical protein
LANFSNSHQAGADIDESLVDRILKVVSDNDKQGQSERADFGCVLNRHGPALKAWRPSLSCP